MNRDQEIGQKIINAIVEGSLMETKEGGQLIVWRENADEQIGQVAIAAFGSAKTTLNDVRRATGDETLQPSEVFNRLSAILARIAALEAENARMRDAMTVLSTLNPQMTMTDDDQNPHRAPQYNTQLVARAALASPPEEKR